MYVEAEFILELLSFPEYLAKVIGYTCCQTICFSPVNCSFYYRAKNLGKVEEGMVDQWSWSNTLVQRAGHESIFTSSVGRGRLPVYPSLYRRKMRFVGLSAARENSEEHHRHHPLIDNRGRD